MGIDPEDEIFKWSAKYIDNSPRGLAGRGSHISIPLL